MNMHARIEGGLGAHPVGRTARAVLGLLIPGSFLGGAWASPEWIFTASVLSLLLVMSALLDGRLPRGLRRPAAEGARETAPYRRRLGAGWRLVRGVSGAAAMSSVLADALVDAYILDAFEIFVLNMGGAYLAMTAAFQDPVKALFSGLPPDSRATPPVTATLPGTGRVTDPRPDPARHAA